MLVLTFTIKTIIIFVTARTRSCGKVMFLQVSVILFGGGVPGPGGSGPGGCLLREGGVPGGDPPDGYCCGWYASY